jgi:hypothetical protein
VRIAKSNGPARVVRVVATSGAAPAVATVPSDRPAASRRDNGPAVARAWRIASIYLVALAAMYAGFLALEFRGPGASGALATDALLIFTGVAAALAVGGLVVTLSPVPRAVEVNATSVVVVEWAGRRREFPPLAELRVDVVRRYPANLLSHTEVEAVELAGGRRRRTYQLTPGLLPEHRPSPAEPTPA